MIINEEVDKALELTQEINARVIDSYETKLEELQNALMLQIEVLDSVLQKVEITETEFIEYLKDKISQIKSVLEPQPLVSSVPTQQEPINQEENVVDTSIFLDGIQTQKQEQEQEDEEEDSFESVKNEVEEKLLRWLLDDK